jgi:hypothetical protein
LNFTRARLSQSLTGKQKYIPIMPVAENNTYNHERKEGGRVVESKLIKNKILMSVWGGYVDERARRMSWVSKVDLLQFLNKFAGTDAARG